MIADITIHHKSFGDKTLFTGLNLSFQKNEKVGIIGTNGCGKSTFFKMLDGSDNDYDGEVTIKKGMVLVSTKQEHIHEDGITTLEYITDGLPEFAKLSHDMRTLPETMGDSTSKMQRYSDALERFTDLGYFEVESSLESILSAYQLPTEVLSQEFATLSGGQKRIIELVKVQQAKAHISLIDEPTNHMDYVAKSKFIDWMKNIDSSVIVITHDRDVLKNVDRLVEFRDGKAYTYTGNYDNYLETHTNRVGAEVNEFQIVKRRIQNLTDDVVRFQRMKERARDGGTIKRFKSLEIRARAELAELKDREKPTFWIDKESVKGLSTKISSAYEEHKTRTITIRSKKKDGGDRLLLKVDKLSLGYDLPLFENVGFELREGERLHVVGRNGRGKTTMLRSIINTWKGEALSAKVYAGLIDVPSDVNIGVYEQEIAERRVDMTLSGAIADTLHSKGLPISDQKIRSLMSDYLFNPITDFDRPVTLLSGGQKARLQLIDMMAKDPSLLILDEPTNHLDLPSIEELEGMLSDYHGAVLYVSHDSYFSEHLQANTLTL